MYQGAHPQRELVLVFHVVIPQENGGPGLVISQHPTLTTTDTPKGSCHAFSVQKWGGGSILVEMRCSLGSDCQ